MSERRLGVLDEPEPKLEIAQNPERPIVEVSSVAPGVLKIKRGERPSANNVDNSKITLEQAQAALERVKDIGRSQGGTSQGTAGGGKQKGGYNYGK